MKRGRLIVFEGIDGSGKSSQAAAIAAVLRDRGLAVVTCRDPGSTPVGDAVRELLLHRHDLKLTAAAEMLLYMAARAQLVREVIQPAIDEGRWVIADRFLLSNVVYQGHAGGLPPEQVRQVGEVATGGLSPDVTVLLDADLQTLAKRLDRPLDRLESRGEAYRQRVQQGYHREAADDPSVVTVDASGDPASVQQAILAVLETTFPELTGPAVDD